MFKVRTGVALVAALVALAACGGTDQADTPAADGPRTLKLWHYEGADSAMGKAWAEAVKQFEASHPGVTVTFEAKAFEQIRQSAGMILNSDEAPDVMEYNKGNATAGLLSKQGLLTDLTSEATKRGWDKLLSPSVQTTARYDERGVMGAGNWYGVPNYAEYVMVYYNKDAFKKAGVEVPTTFEEFTAALDTFVKAGTTPIAVGGAEYPAQQIFYQLALSKAQRPWVDAFQLYKGKADFKGPEFTYAADTFADWVKKGYIAKDSAALKAEDMGVSFIGGKYPIMISGSWWYGRLAAEIKDFEWGTFLWPGNTMSAGSSGNLWVVPENAKNKDLAYDFIDITMKKDIQNLLGNSGGVPVAADTAAITDPKSKELIENFNKLSTSDGLAFYPDWPAPGYYDVLVAGVQHLINGTKTSGQVLDEIAAPYDENLADIGN
ncbi:raffinose/stachyose/melibiose transport system substrate-binding protein [Streptosporangium becharense]|uniref:Raffinose/stachyose/melibiose transport system substrate-binding protein n=1 Tax=Streptosporangium becharense TaxID=1816182 RepID=A0A7W9MGH3_9ACTN|nr:extracellular solute-binding protein [Streptosporangium becharense]MBB2909610.1 raffinose/stachyose/melibiose transport system substrate-binding protein [Streptosporangium becharense]MBB5819434.1 raffinose/stachyose/melibiose transport system substrate-binding protein [Streptosporangium becharense]